MRGFQNERKALSAPASLGDLGRTGFDALVSLVALLEIVMQQ
jgi:hypothetical protein